MRFLFLTSKHNKSAAAIADALKNLNHQVDQLYVPTYVYGQQLQQKIFNLIQKHQYQIVHAFSYPSLLLGFQSKSSAKKIVTVDNFAESHSATIIKPVIAHALSQYDVIHVTNPDLASKVKTQTRRLALIVPDPEQHLDELYGITL